MKKLVFSMLCLFAISLGIKAEDDRITSDINELPAQSREFIREWFGDVGIAHIKIDNNYEGRVKDYEVLLANGIEIEFDKSGEWKEIEANKMGLPEGILQTGIIDQIHTLHPGQQIRKMEKDGNKIEVKLFNYTKLKFDQSGTLLN
ncbi:MAG: PepSY-like domain-containing protein [Tannerellaceae bacterium]|nr:PepSY-like domain-containing protein [Tannerellaceae bacterium]